MTQDSPGPEAVRYLQPMARRIYIETYGCQMNVADSELMFGLLGREGYVRTDEPADADVMLVNTCAVRDNAEQRVIGRSRMHSYIRARIARYLNPLMMIALLSGYPRATKSRAPSRANAYRVRWPL